MVINNLYFNPIASTPDRARLLNIARAWDPGITREQLDNWIDNMREDLLTRIYYDGDVDLGSKDKPPAPGFSSVDKTWRFARRVDPWITKGEVADFIRKQTIDQDLQRARRLGTFLTTGALEQVEIDLADFTTKAARGDRVSMYGWEQGSPSLATPSWPSITSRRSLPLSLRTARTPPRSCGLLTRWSSAWATIDPTPPSTAPGSLRPTRWPVLR